MVRAGMDPPETSEARRIAQSVKPRGPQTVARRVPGRRESRRASSKQSTHRLSSQTGSVPQLAQTRSEGPRFRALHSLSAMIRVSSVILILVLVLELCEDRGCQTVPDQVETEPRRLGHVIGVASELV